MKDRENPIHPDLESHASGTEPSDARWVRILDEYLTEACASFPDNPRVLNVGCGNRVKWNYLGVTLYLAARDLGMPRYVAVDQEEERFADARKDLGELVRFMAGDAQRLTDFLSGVFHMVIIEHPDLTTSRDRPRTWRRIFKEIHRVLDEDGCLVLTSFWLNDHIPAQVALERSGYRVLFTGTNKYPGRHFDTANNGEPLYIDKYILIAKKRGAQGKGRRANNQRDRRSIHPAAAAGLKSPLP